MTDDAAIFSRHYRILFEKPMTTAQAEELLRECIMTIGRGVACNNIILGHIKILARLSKLAVEHFLFLSLTRLEQVDVIPSNCWRNVSGIVLDSLELEVNVLVFGHALGEVEAKVGEALGQLGGSMEEDSAIGSCR